MRVKITGRHTRIPDDVKDYAERKLEPLSRFNRHAQSVEVILDEDHLSKLVECIAHLDRGAPLIVKAKHPDWKAVLDIAHDKLEVALRRMKERIDDRNRGQQRELARAGDELPPIDEDGGDEVGDATSPTKDNVAEVGEE